MFSISEFLKLPDWKKVELKLMSASFRNFPLMTEEQFQIRESKYRALCDYFSNITQEDEPDILIVNHLPKDIKKLVTPKLFEFIDIKGFTYFGHCQFCCYFKGHTKINHKKYMNHKKSKLVSLYGMCQYLYENYNVFDDHYTALRLATVRSYSNCNQWTPVPLIRDIFTTRLHDYIKNVLHKVYPFKEYKRDLEVIDNIYGFFNNTYKPDFLHCSNREH